MSKILAFGKTDRPETAEQPLRYTACGLDDVYLLNGFTRETIDGEEYVTIEDLEDLWKAIGLHLVKTRKSLAPKEIKFLRQHMDMTQAELAVLEKLEEIDAGTSYNDTIALLIRDVTETRGGD